MTFTYSPPDSKAFVNTLRIALEAAGALDLAALLVGSDLEISTEGQFSNGRWNAYSATANLRVRADLLHRFTATHKHRLLELTKSVMPAEVGYDIWSFEISPVLESPPDEDSPLPGPTFKPERAFRHDDLWFRSKSEIKIYEVLKQKGVLFFANATAVLGQKNLKREPDFLVCLDGKWGVLEVNGEHFHPVAARDHDRARLFKEYGLSVVEFYDAQRCYQQPQEVVDSFLALLKRLA
jgi:hypothetical protein